MDFGGPTIVHFGGITLVHLRGATLVHLGRTTVVDFGRLGGQRTLEEDLEGPARDVETAGYFTRREALRPQLVDGCEVDRVVILGQR